MKQKRAKSGARMWTVRVCIDGDTKNKRWRDVGLAFDNSPNDRPDELMVQLDAMPLPNAKWDGKIYLYPIEE